MTTNNTQPEPTNTPTPNSESGATAPDGAPADTTPAVDSADSDSDDSLNLSAAFDLFGEDSDESPGEEPGSPVSGGESPAPTPTETPTQTPVSTQEPATTEAQPTGPGGQQQQPPSDQQATAADSAPQAPVKEQAEQPAPSDTGPAPNALETLRGEIEKHQDAFVEALSNSVYKLDESQQAEVLDTPETAIPKLMARVHMEVTKNVIGSIAQQIPNTVAGVLQAREASTRHEKAFYEKWPQLSPEQDSKVVLQLAANYRRNNPDATPEEVIQMVGAQALVATGKYQQQQPTEQQAPKAKPAPFVPAGNGTQAPPPVSGNSSNPWASAFNELIED